MVIVAVYLAAAVLFIAAVGALAKYGGYSASEAIYFVTGVVLLAYTIETWRLRREAQLQTELQNRPFVPLTLDDHRIFGLVNVGNGVATSVSIVDIDLTNDRRYRLHAEPITHLGPGQQFRLRWTTFQQAPDGECLEMWDGEEFPHQLLAKRGAQLHVTYQAIVGKRRYETVLSIREITDEFPEPRISII